MTESPSARRLRDRNRPVASRDRFSDAVGYASEGRDPPRPQAVERPRVGSARRIVVDWGLAPTAIATSPKPDDEMLTAAGSVVSTCRAVVFAQDRASVPPDPSVRRGERGRARSMRCAMSYALGVRFSTKCSQARRPMPMPATAVVLEPRETRRAPRPLPLVGSPIVPASSRPSPRVDGERSRCSLSQRGRARRDLAPAFKHRQAGQRARRTRPVRVLRNNLSRHPRGRRGARLVACWCSARWPVASFRLGSPIATRAHQLRPGRGRADQRPKAQSPELVLLLQPIPRLPTAPTAALAWLKTSTSAPPSHTVVPT